MFTRSSPLRSILILVPIMLGGCQALNWKQTAAAEGEQQVRTDIGDPAAKFSDVQVVGDSKTGQVCGKVLGQGVSTKLGLPARFIVYVDHTAGPWIEGRHGHDTVPDERFDFAWEHDCVGEGWRQP